MCKIKSILHTSKLLTLHLYDLWFTKQKVNCIAECFFCFSRIKSEYNLKAKQFGNEHNTHVATLNHKIMQIYFLAIKHLQKFT